MEEETLIFHKSDKTDMVDWDPFISNGNNKLKKYVITLFLRRIFGSM
jgi:hypothetical protein